MVSQATGHTVRRTRVSRVLWPHTPNTVTVTGATTVVDCDAFKQTGYPVGFQISLEKRTRIGRGPRSAGDRAAPHRTPHNPPGSSSHAVRNGLFAENSPEEACFLGLPANRPPQRLPRARPRSRPATTYPHADARFVNHLS